MKEREMISPSNNDLPTPTNDVIVNPENPVNPDSKTTRCCAPLIKLNRTTTPAVARKAIIFINSKNICSF